MKERLADVDAEDGASLRVKLHPLTSRVDIQRLSPGATGRTIPLALKPGRLREIVTGMCVDWGVSIRRACGAICFDTSTYHYKSRRTGQAAVERRIKEIAETRVRYGYRRVHVLLRREGWIINMKKTRRIYNELGLQLRNKHPKRRVKAKLREDRREATGPNDVWAMHCPKGDCASAICRKGFCPRPACLGKEVAHPDGCRHALPSLPGD